MANVSVIMACQNGGEFLEPALKSARWADEIVVVDAGSTDHTPEIARRYANRYVQEPWRGFTGQKQYAVSLARNDWVLILDHDEEISPQLAEEIQGLSDATLAAHDLFEVPRRNYVMGRFTRAWWPDLQSRLFHRGRVTWADEVIHDRRLPSSPERLGQLRGPLEHRRHSQAGFGDYFDGRAEDERICLAAEQMYARGTRCHWWSLLLHPAAAFFKSYVLKAGMIDGTFGLMIALKGAQATRLKYAALWALQNAVPLRRP